MPIYMLHVVHENLKEMHWTTSPRSEYSAYLIRPEGAFVARAVFPHILAHAVHHTHREPTRILISIDIARLSLSLKPATRRTRSAYLANRHMHLRALSLLTMLRCTANFISYISESSARSPSYDSTTKSDKVGSRGK